MPATPDPRPPLAVDLGSVDERDAERIIRACRVCAARMTQDEAAAFETLARYAQMRLNLARGNARRNDPVVVER